MLVSDKAISGEGHDAGVGLLSQCDGHARRGCSNVRC